MAVCDHAVSANDIVRHDFMSMLESRENEGKVGYRDAPT